MSMLSMTHRPGSDAAADGPGVRYGQKSPSARRSSASKTPQSPWAALIICGIACVAFPALVTAIAPVTYLKLSRSEGVVNATSSTCLLFCIPYIIQKTADVQSVGHRVIAGEVVNSHERDADGQINSTPTDDEGFLVLTGAATSLEIQVSPHDLATHQAAIEAFLKSDQPGLRRFCISNWKAAIFAGVPLCSLTVLYLVSVFNLIWRFAGGLTRLGGSQRSGT